MLHGKSNAKKYRCEVCGYIYDPAQGDELADVPPDTPFEDLPDGWVCRICGAGKDEGRWIRAVVLLLIRLR